MIEKVTRISNPLTIIAIFAALAEMAGTVSLGLIDQSLQGIFVWFVMLFPILLVLAFFITLNFNPKVLYAPRDFRDDQSFIATMSGSFRKPSISVCRDNVAQIVRELQPQPDKQTHSQVPGMIDATAHFFGAMVKKLAKDFEDGRLRSADIWIIGEGYYLLEIEIPKAVLDDQKAERDLILIQELVVGHQVALRAIGKNIQENNPDAFAVQMYERLADFLNECVDPSKLSEFRKKMESAHCGRED